MVEVKQDCHVINKLAAHPFILILILSNGTRNCKYRRRDTSRKSIFIAGFGGRGGLSVNTLSQYLSPPTHTVSTAKSLQ